MLLMDVDKEKDDSGKQVLVGICAMAKKSNSKPMKEILARLEEFEYIQTVIFPEETILKVMFMCVCTYQRQGFKQLITASPQEPVDKWPVCDCLISFHSKGFPLEKAVSYAELVRPYIINNLRKQFDLQVISICFIH